MKTTNGIPCNDYIHTPKAKHDRITYRFVTDDNNTPSSCTIRLGDTDPLTGEPIADVDFFTEYYRLVDHQVYTNLKSARVNLTPEEKRRFTEEKTAFIKAFEEKYGYHPHRDDIRNALEDRWPKTYHLSIQEMINDEGDSKADQRMDLSEPAADPFDGDTPDDIAALRGIAASLTGRMADIYEALLIKYAGGKEKITMTSLARKWNVSVTQICSDRDRIIQMIRDSITHRD